MDNIQNLAGFKIEFVPGNFEDLTLPPFLLQAEITLYVKRIWFLSVLSKKTIEEAMAATIEHEIVEILCMEEFPASELVYLREECESKIHRVMERLELMDTHIYTVKVEEIDLCAS